MEKGRHFSPLVLGVMLGLVALYMTGDAGISIALFLCSPALALLGLLFFVTFFFLFGGMLLWVGFLFAFIFSLAKRTKYRRLYGWEATVACGLWWIASEFQKSFTPPKPQSHPIDFSGLDKYVFAASLVFCFVAGVITSALAFRAKEKQKEWETAVTSRVPLRRYFETIGKKEVQALMEQLAREKAQEQQKRSSAQPPPAPAEALPAPPPADAPETPPDEEEKTP